MPIDPNTGLWKEEDESVSKRLNGLLAQDNAYMKQAETAGLQQAGKRGLVNSSMAVGAVEDSRIKSALPIASQEASQTHARNLSAQQFGQENVLQGARIKSTEGIAAADRQGAMDRQMAADRAAYERSLADNAAAKDRLGIQLTSEEKRARDADVAAMARQTAGDAAALTRATEVQRLSDVAAMARQTNANAAAGDLARLNNESQERVAAADRVTRARDSVMQNLNSANATYNQALTAIHNNPNIPANVATQMAVNAAAIRDGTFNLIEQVSDIELHWSSPALPPPPPPPSTSTTTTTGGDAESVSP